MTRCARTSFFSFFLFRLLSLPVFEYTLRLFPEEQMRIIVIIIIFIYNYTSNILFILVLSESI